MYDNNAFGTVTVRIYVIISNIGSKCACNLQYNHLSYSNIIFSYEFWNEFKESLIIWHTDRVYS